MSTQLMKLTEFLPVASIRRHFHPTWLNSSRWSGDACRHRKIRVEMMLMTMVCVSSHKFYERSRRTRPEGGDSG